MGGIGFYTNSTAAMTLAMHKKMAMEMATQAMEQMKDAGYVSLSDYAVRTCEAASTVTFGDFSALKQRCLTGGANANKTVEIQINWTEPGKQTSRVVNLATYMAPP